MRSEGYGIDDIVRNYIIYGYGSLCVCVSVKSHLTSGASVRRENAATHSAGNEGQKIVAFSLKLLRCRDRAVPPLMAIHRVGHFSWG